MPNIEVLTRWLEQIAPLRLAEDWDNVGLLVGHRDRDVERVMTCLTLTPDVVEEAVERRANLVVVHHPLPFRPLKTLTSETISGGMLLALAENRIAVYSPHTAWDSADSGINQMWAERLGLSSIQPLKVAPADADSPSSGSGRYGRLPQPLGAEALARQVAVCLSLPAFAM